MLSKIELVNFKCYKKHSVDFKELTVIVGKNNAGKSTLIEALRLVAIVFLRFKNLNYVSPPEWTNLHLSDKGILPSLKNIEYIAENVVHNYEDPPAKIIGIFRNKIKVVIFLDENRRIFAQIYNENGELVKSRLMANELNISGIKILPQIGPIQKEERLLLPEYVKANEFTSLTSLHFRNQIQNSYEFFNEFKNQIETTWSGITIHNFIKGDRIKEENPALLIRESSFVTEAGKMGHGLQMWLQIIWFLQRCEKNDTIILDEPDVYLHADIQRKLIRFLKGRYKQIILATHSIEIISEVDPENILIVDKNKQKSKFASSNPIVQEIIDQLGSLHNLELIRLWSSKRFLIFEGNTEDLNFLKIFQDKLFPNSEIPIDSIPKIHIDGWGGWQKVIGSHRVISQNSEVSTYCILDSDYHTNLEIQKRYDEAQNQGINLHIWSKKEIENYLLIDSAITRFINKRSQMQIDQSYVRQILNNFCEELKDNIIDDIATELNNIDKSKALKTHISEARSIVNSKWTTLEEKLSIVPGKEFISRISRWSKKNYNVSINRFALAKEVTIEEINDEIKKTVIAIERKEILK